MKFNLSFFSDLLFYAACAFLISFTALRFALKSVVGALILSAFIALFITAVLAVLTQKRIIRRQQIKLDDGECKNLCVYLSLAAGDLTESLFLSALDDAFADGDVIFDSAHAYVFRFKIAPIDSDDIAAALKLKTELERVVLCCRAGDSAKAFAGDFGVQVWEIEKIYSLLKNKNLLPKEYPHMAKAKRARLERLKKRFNRKLCPSLFFSGFFLLAFSFFTFYPLYYVIFGSVVILLSCACLFFSPAYS